MTTNTALLAREFPDFDLATLPAIPEGFECTAWHNDTAPTWHERMPPKHGDMMLVVDFNDPELREVPESPRFGLQLYGGDYSPVPFFDTDDWTAMEAAIRLVRLIRQLGYAFHPDSPPSEYISGASGDRLFSDAEAAAFVADMEAVGASSDLYEFGMAVWRGMGLLTEEEGR